MDRINTDKAPAAVGPYSQAVRAGGFLFCSGQIGIDPATKSLAGNDIEAQTRQVFTNVKAVLGAAGLGLADVVKATVFLRDMNDFPVMNALYEKLFGNHKPARSTIEVSRLPLDAVIEIEFIAADNK